MAGVTSASCTSPLALWHPRYDKVFLVRSPSLISLELWKRQSRVSLFRKAAPHGTARHWSNIAGSVDTPHSSSKVERRGPHQSMDDRVQRRLQQFHEGSDGPPLRILPIGGLGEIGMNCMLVGHYDRYILIDAGLMFPDYEDLGVQKILPDTGFIHRWRHKIEALVITHGHEDHIGALPWVFPILDPTTPVYATSFTMELIKRRLDEYSIQNDGRLNTFEMKYRFNAGPFEIEPFRVTHSIPDCCGLILRCQDGTIFHTGDWKEEVIRLVKPQHFMPVHGEFAFLKEHERLGRESGIRHTAVIKNGEMLGVAHLRNRRVLSNGFSLLGREDLQLMYNDGDRAFGTATDLCVGERMRIALNGIVVASIDVSRRGLDTKKLPKRGEKDGGGPSIGLRGRVKITTRCLWVDRGKLLESLQKAASAALASLQLHSTLGLVEHTVGVALRRVVQKYSNRRPDIIVIATENDEASASEAKMAPSRERDLYHNAHGSRVFNEQINSIKGRRRDGVVASKAFERVQSAISKTSAVARMDAEPNARESLGHLRKKSKEVTREISEIAVSSWTTNLSHPEVDSKVPESLNTAAESSKAAVGSVAFSNFQTGTQADVAREASVVDQFAQPVARPVTAASSGDKLIISSKDAFKDSLVKEVQEEPHDDTSKPAAPVKRRKWKSKEIFVLIEARKHKEIGAQQGQGRKGLWKGVSETLAEAGFDRSPDQCKQMWFSLVKRYKSWLQGATQDVETGARPKKSFVFFEALEKALAVIEKSETRIR